MRRSLLVLSTLVLLGLTVGGAFADPLVWHTEVTIRGRPSGK
jgi:hypothetical protein